MREATSSGLRVGILGRGLTSWGGGLHFLRLICSSLAASGIPTELHVLQQDSTAALAPRAVARRLRSKIASLLRHRVAVAHTPPAASVAQELAEVGAPVRVHHIDPNVRALADACQRLSLNVLLPAMQALPFGREAPWIGYIPDFQHRRLPELFSAPERRARDRMFSAVLAKAPVVLVNAHDVATDARRFCPGASSRVVVLPFAAAPVASWFGLDVEAAQTRYRVSHKYFMICNQFWKHKDHATAFDAFAAFAARSPNVRLVCTGAPSDYRDAAHFDSLMQRARRARIDDRLLVLGYVPKSDQIALLRGSIALIQPTLFEGGPGGGAVYDAVSVGKRCIVSDIPVNLEIGDEPLVRFFEAGNPDHLQQALCDAMDAPDHVASPAELIEAGSARLKTSGRQLLQAISMATKPASVA